MRARSLTTTLAIAFAATTLAVFGIVGSYVYIALEHQVTVQDDLDIVLAARHTRRLTSELSNYSDIERFQERLRSQVLGSQALSLEIADSSGRMLMRHNVDALLAQIRPPAKVVPADAQITDTWITATNESDGDPIRLLAVHARMTDGSLATIVVLRDMRDRWRLLDRYRDRLHLAGIVGVLLAFAIGFFLVRRALAPLRTLAESAGEVTSDRLNTRIVMNRVPSELEPLIESLNDMIAGLERSFQRMSQFTADLAHDMRTPLANMRGATEVVLARPRSPDEYQSVLASNLEECDRLSRMIENVIFLARAEHPQFARQMQDFRVDLELQRIAEYFEGLADEAGVEIVVRGTGVVTAVIELFRRAVSNLLANAMRYTTRGKTITMSVIPSPREVSVCVENEGAIVDPAMLDRIFDRFYRGDPSRGGAASATGSAGLGLAIVRTIMELHRGRARAESDQRSTRFILTFPAKEAV